MKRFLATLLSIALAFAVFALVGCDEKKADLKMTEVMQKLDLSKGVTVTLDADVTSGGQRVEATGAIKMTLNDVFKLDFEGNAGFNGEKSDYKAYIRGTDAYISNEGQSDLFTKVSLDELDMDMDINSLISALTVNTTTSFDIGKNIIDDEVIFYKNGNDLKAEIDLFGICVRVLNKVNGVIDILNANTTIKQIYNKLEGDKLLNKLFGEVKGKDAYDEMLKQIKDLPADSLPEDMGGIIKTLPTNVEAFIGMINTMAGLNLPEMGDKTLKVYIKEVLMEYFDMTVLDLFLDQISEGEITEADKEQIKQQIDDEINAFKKEAETYIGQITDLLKANKCKITVLAQKDGTLNEISLDISIDKELSEFLGEMDGVKFSPYATEPDPVTFAMKVNLKFDYATPQFVDESKLNVEDKAIDDEEQIKKANIFMAREYALQSILAKYEEYSDADGFYVTVTISSDEKIIDSVIVTEAPADAEKFIVTTCEKTDSGYIVYLYIANDDLFNK